MADAAGTLRAYRSIIRGRVRSQAEYRSSFAFELFGSAFVGVVEFAEIYAIFGRTKAIAGFGYDDMLLLFGFATFAFSLADLCVGHIESLSTYVRTGTFETLLLRPLSAVGQLATSDFSLRRFGRALLGFGVLGYGLHAASIRWTPAHIVIAITTPVLGAFIYSCIFVGTASISFWLVDAGEFASAFTYGGRYVASFPFSVYGVALRQFFTFVVPVAFVSYVPTLSLLGRLDSGGWPLWAGACPIVAAVAVFLVARVLWRSGVRHYVGAGG